MKIRLLWVGRTKEPWIAEGISKYLALLRPMAQVSTVEVKEERGAASGTASAIEKEADRVLKQSSGGKFILLDARARPWTPRGLRSI